ncbi:hypothetical protein BCAH820_4367 [Bacillus cereus AH820]|uniref:DUF2441 domain-containing protein n=1 Tax=Bacillus cereus (strain AH820) TaxID=405535 RepID=B7JNX7_BACC0|nr:DUF2441 domain-containing protein [Bacillus cereus]ACK88080.1 hypothetical protein BCAH820_4367 [Bacillus cereus AH820]
MGIFYHASNADLKKGDLLTIKYGKAMQHPNFYKESEHNYAQHLREMIFEEVRKVNFPSAPSRLDSKYLVKDLKAALAYRKKFNINHVYEVEIEEPGRIITADMTWIDFSSGKHYEELKMLAHNYFSEKRSENYFFETLYDGPVRVKKKVSL